MEKEHVLILPNIRSCHNVGAMFRTADAFNIKKLYLCGYTAHPPKIQIDKVSLGAETWIDWEKVEDTSALIANLQKEGYSIIALEKNNTSADITQFVFPQKTALILGNEVDGVSQTLLDLADAVVHIPMYGKKESLNVSIAAGIAMYAMKHNS